MYHTFLVCIEKANNSEYFFNIEKNISVPLKSGRVKY